MNLNTQIATQTISPDEPLQNNPIYKTYLEESLKRLMSTPLVPKQVPYLPQINDFEEELSDTNCSTNSFSYQKSIQQDLNNFFLEKKESIQEYDQKVTKLIKKQKETKNKSEKIPPKQLKQQQQEQEEQLQQFQQNSEELYEIKTKEQQSSQQKKQFSFFCQVCQKSYDYRETIDKNDLENYYCQCDKIMGQEQQKQLDFYLKNLNKSELLKCNQCKYQATQKQFIVKHIKNVHQKKIFHCNDCSFKSATLGNINFHLKTFHKEVDYCCKLCDFKVNNLQYIKKHIINKHNNNIKICPVDGCNFQTKSTEQFTRHKRKKHNIFSHINKLNNN